MFTIPKGTKCHVYKKASGTGWQPFVTTKELTFLSHGVTDNGGRWVFDNGDGWVLKVPSCHVVGREAKAETDADRGTFNRCILGRNGKGANRRRNRRRGR